MRHGCDLEQTPSLVDTQLTDDVGRTVPALIVGAVVTLDEGSGSVRSSRSRNNGARAAHSARGRKAGRIAQVRLTTATRRLSWIANEAVMPWPKSAV